MKSNSKASKANLESVVVKITFGGSFKVLIKSKPVKLGICISRKIKSTVFSLRYLIAPIASENSSTKLILVIKNDLI